MEQTPMVSIIVPVYNVERYLRQCLDSLVNQTYQNVEIICVDDGSADRSGEILNQYGGFMERKKNHSLKKNKKVKIEKRY